MELLTETMVPMVSERKLTDGSKGGELTAGELVSDSVEEAVFWSSRLETLETLPAWEAKIELSTFDFSISVEFEPLLSAKVLFSVSFKMLSIDSSMMFTIVVTSSFPVVLLSVVVAAASAVASLDIAVVVSAAIAAASV